MKNKIKLLIVRSALTLVLAALAAGLVILFPGEAQMETQTGKDMREVISFSSMDYPPDQAKNDVERGNPAVEFVLNRLVDIYNSKGPEAAAEFASRHDIPFNGDQLKVILDADVSLLPGFPTAMNGQSSPNIREVSINRAVSLIRSEIERLGGAVERTHRYLVQCSIGIRSLNELASVPGVRSIRRPIQPLLHATSEGVHTTGAHQYHGLTAFKSSGVKVLVLDVGFKGYRDLLGEELPETVTTHSFTDDGDIEADEVHGTGCAEIVHDMAPDAELFLANVYWTSDLIDAIEWAVEQEIDIISYSLGSYWGPGDGTGFENSLAQWAHQNGGVVWVTSAGNAADDHWSGTFNDPDGDGWHNFSGEDELLNFYVPADMGIEYGVDVYLKWNDWGTWDDYYGYSGSDQDFDFYLFIKEGNDWQLVDTSENRQPQYKWPWESIEGWYSLDDAQWGVAIRKINAAKDVFFDLYILTHSQGSLEYNVPESSLSTPADSPYVIAVGAVDAVGDYYHFYSSQGPTSDGRIKPDICAPSAVSTSDTSYGLRYITGGFAGTSASCPHAAGAIALLKGKTPFSLEEIKTILYSRAIDMGEPGKDNIFGWGRLNLRRQ